MVNPAREEHPGPPLSQTEWWIILSAIALEKSLGLYHTNQVVVVGDIFCLEEPEKQGVLVFHVGD